MHLLQQPRHGIGFVLLDIGWVDEQQAAGPGIRQPVGDLVKSVAADAGDPWVCVEQRTQAFQRARLPLDQAESIL